MTLFSNAKAMWSIHQVAGVYILKSVTRMIERYVNEIKKCVEIECYFPALALALALPDMCATVEWPNKEVHERYIQWCDEYIFKNHYKNNKGFSGESLYNLRNVFLHRGEAFIDNKRIKDQTNKIDQLIFHTGEDDTLESIMEIEVNNPPVQNEKLKIEIIKIDFLCEIICKSTLEYYQKNKERFSFNIVMDDMSYLKKLHEINNKNVVFGEDGKIYIYENRD